MLDGTGRQAGVTAIEMSVILAIIAILALAAMLSLGNVREVTEAKGAAEQVASAIHQARAYAVVHAATYEIVFPGGSQVEINCVTFCGGSPPEEGPTELIHNATVTPPGTPITFTSTGASNGGTVLVNPGAEQRTVTVTIAGRVQITPP